MNKMIKMIKIRLISLILSLIFGIGGFWILWVAAGWKVSVGVFLVLWGHQIEKHFPDDTTKLQ